MVKILIKTMAKIFDDLGNLRFDNNTRSQNYNLTLFTAYFQLIYRSKLFFAKLISLC